jgi:hypothetical protein
MHGYSHKKGREYMLELEQLKLEIDPYRGKILEMGDSL